MIMRNTSIILFCAIFFCISFVQGNHSVTKEEIFAAAKTGNCDFFATLIQEKQNLTMTDENGNTLFHVAAKHGHSKLIELLAKYKTPQGITAFFSGPYKPDINSQNNDGDTALHCAIGTDNEEALIMLIIHNADTNIYNKKKQTALLHAASQGNIEDTFYLMQMSDEYYNHTVDQNNILHIALEQQQYELVKKIIHSNNLIATQYPNHPQATVLLKAHNKYNEPALCWCVRTHNKEALSLLLSHDNTIVQECIDVSDNKGYRPISHACHDENSDVINQLVQHKANLNISAPADAMPIHIALGKNNYSLATQLLNFGANIDTQENEDGYSVLHSATTVCDAVKVGWLLSHHASVDILNKKKHDALAIAINKSHKQLIPLLMSYGANVNRTDNSGKTRLMLVLSDKNNDMVDYLLNLNVNTNQTDKQGNSALHITTIYNNLQGAELLLKKNKTLLHKHNEAGNTPLHLAADNSLSSRFVVFYLEQGAGVNTQNNKGEAAIHRAAMSGNRESIEKLKQKKASLSLLTKENNSPAHCALLYNTLNCLPDVLDKGSINVINNNGKTVFHLAIEKQLFQQTLQTIANFGVDLYLRTRDTHDTYLHHAILYEHHDAIAMLAIPALINQKNNANQTPLSYAVQKNNPWAVDLLLKRNASVNIPDIHGWTEMHHVATTGEESIFDALYNDGSSLIKRDDAGNTALHIAAQYNTISIVKKIIQKDDNLGRENDKGHTPFMTAALCDNLEITKHLIREDDFRNGRVNAVVAEMRLCPIASSTQRYLEYETNQRNNEIQSILDMQQYLIKMDKQITVAQSMLSQKAIKEHAHFAYTAIPFLHCPSYNQHDLNMSDKNQRNHHKQLLSSAIQHVEKEYAEIMKRMETIDGINRDIELEKLRQKREQERIAIAAQVAAQLAEKAIINEKPAEQNGADNKNDSSNSEYECNNCRELKQDAKKRCVNEKCDTKICNECMQGFRNSSHESCKTCIYCFNPWLQN